jgi:hypothetical protein
MKSAGEDSDTTSAIFERLTLADSAAVLEGGARCLASSRAENDGEILYTGFRSIVRMNAASSSGIGVDRGPL